MKTIIYECDKCKAKIQCQGGDIGNRIINISIQTHYEGPHMCITKTRRSAQWCRKCAMDARLELGDYGEKRKLPPEPTFEELFRELVADVVQAAIE